jgi:PAS domain-containing protein
MADAPPLANPDIQALLIAEALGSASVGFLVWDEDLRYIAANSAACEILGTTLDELLGERVGAHSLELDGQIDDAIRKGFHTGTATVNRFDDSGRVQIFYATFATRSAGMPFMATVIAPVR